MMSKFIALLTVGLFVFIPCISCVKLGPDPGTLPSRQRSLQAKEVTLSGTVYDRTGNAMPGADVQLKAPDFSEIYMTKTNEYGKYSIKAIPGTYYSFYACRDYGENNLEYWAWDIPLHQDMTLDAFVDRLEIYGLNAFPVRFGGYNTMYLQFRPMSLSKVQEQNLSKSSELPNHIEIAPDMRKNGMTVTINDLPAQILDFVIIPEVTAPITDEKQYMDGFLIQVEMPETCIDNKSYKVSIHLTDYLNGDEGEGCVFVKTHPYMTSAIEIPY